MSIRHLFLLAFAALSACTGWTPTPVPETDPPAYRQFEIVTGDSITILYAVRLANDTLSGVPIRQSRDCETCRVAIPVDAIQSIRSGTSPNAGTVFLATTGGLVAGLLLLSLGIALSGGVGD